MNWERIDNCQPYELYREFEYIREDAECQRFEEEFEAAQYVEAIICRDFPKIWDKIRYDDIQVEFYEFDFLEEDDEHGYAVYIHVNEKFRQAMKEENPEFYL